MTGNQRKVLVCQRESAFLGHNLDLITLFKVLEMDLVGT